MKDTLVSGFECHSISYCTFRPLRNRTELSRCTETFGLVALVSIQTAAHSRCSELSLNALLPLTVVRTAWRTFRLSCSAFLACTCFFSRLQTLAAQRWDLLVCSNFTRHLLSSYVLSVVRMFRGVDIRYIIYGMSEEHGVVFATSS